jgi:hypothetical protein
METILEILKYILPSLVVFLTAYFLIKSYLNYRQNNDKLQLRKKDQEIILPLRLQSYERMILFLERISPVQAIFRVRKQDMSPAQLQASLVQSIREEYEHNIAQQIYISQEGWNMVRNAREEVTRQINTAFINLGDDANANDLAQMILESWGQTEKNPVQSAIDFLKNEVRQLF